MPKQNKELEPLDLANVIEIQKIRELLVEHPELLSMFEILIIMCNKKLNIEDEKKIIS